jgi:hypothetical protein
MGTAAIILGAFVLFLVSLYLTGRWLSRAWARRHPESHAVAEVTPTGIALVGCLVLALTVGVAARSLAPDSGLGSFLSTFDGIRVGAIMAVGVFTIAAVVLDRLGHPTIKRKEARGV